MSRTTCSPVKSHLPVSEGWGRWVERASAAASAPRAWRARGRRRPAEEGGVGAARAFVRAWGRGGVAEREGGLFVFSIFGGARNGATLRIRAPRLRNIEQSARLVQLWFPETLLFFGGVRWDRSRSERCCFLSDGTGPVADLFVPWDRLHSKRLSVLCAGPVRKKETRQASGFGKMLAKCGKGENMCALYLKQTMAKCRGSVPFCENPACLDPFWRPVKEGDETGFGIWARATPDCGLSTALTDRRTESAWRHLSSGTQRGGQSRGD